MSGSLQCIIMGVSVYGMPRLTLPRFHLMLHVRAASAHSQSSQALVQATRTLMATWDKDDGRTSAVHSLVIPDDPTATCAPTMCIQRTAQRGYWDRCSIGTLETYPGVAQPASHRESGEAGWLLRTATMAAMAAAGCLAARTPSPAGTASAPLGTDLPR